MADTAPAANGETFSNGKFCVTSSDYTKALSTNNRFYRPCCPERPERNQQGLCRALLSRRFSQDSCRPCRHWPTPDTLPLFLL